MTTSTPAPSCRSCGSFPALPDGELCAACRHAVEYHGASFVDAYAVPCEGCDRVKIQTSPEAQIPCVNCGSTACEWPGECKPRGQLPIVEIEGTRYYRDDRLEEYRNVDDPHDRITFEFFDGSEEGLPGDPPTCEACGAPLHEGACPVCTAPLEAPEEILDILNDLIEWDACVGPFENEVWDRARAIRDRLVVK